MSIENFTLYTKVDPNNRFTVTAPKIVTTGMTRSETAYVYSDKVANPFDGDFEQLLDTKIVSGTANFTFHPWHLANVIDDWWEQFSGNENFLSLYWIGGFNQLRIVESDGGVLYSDTSFALTINTYFYLTLTRDETIGSFGQLKCEIFSDVGRSVPVQTLTLALHTAKRDYRYIYGAISLNNSTGGVVSGEIKNLDLQEAAGGFQAAWARNSNQIIGSGVL